MVLRCATAVIVVRGSFAGKGRWNALTPRLAADQSTVGWRHEGESLGPVSAFVARDCRSSVTRSAKRGNRRLRQGLERSLASVRRFVIEWALLGVKSLCNRANFLGEHRFANIGIEPLQPGTSSQTVSDFSRTL